MIRWQAMSDALRGAVLIAIEEAALACESECLVKPGLRQGRVFITVSEGTKCLRRSHKCGFSG